MGPWGPAHEESHNHDYLNFLLFLLGKLGYVLPFLTEITYLSLIWDLTFANQEV